MRWLVAFTPFPLRIQVELVRERTGKDNLPFHRIHYVMYAIVGVRPPIEHQELVRNPLQVGERAMRKRDTLDFIRLTTLDILDPYLVLSYAFTRSPSSDVRTKRLALVEDKFFLL